MEKPVDNYFSLWITQCYIVFDTISVGVPCPLSIGGADRRGRSAGLSGRDRARKSQKIGVQHDGKNLFCALFLIFSKNFYALKTHVFVCFRLFCEPLRARAFSLSLKKTARKIFFRNLLTYGVHGAILCTQSRNGTSPDALTGTASTV